MIVNHLRTRFAPSPTGYMHVGNLRTALYAYLLAKQAGGQFLLRIEDTDQGRLVEGAVEKIYHTLRETGLLWDEGPDVGGPVGPYIQSQRVHMHKEYALQLIEKGAAYYCFCDRERLDALKASQTAAGQDPMYDRHCCHLSPEEIKAKLDGGAAYVIRQKTPDTGSTTFHDEVYGDITVENATLDDQVLIKADGMATYNFANVVDDHLMGITHVIRGSEYLSSTPKYNLLYEAFGWEVPTYIHCSPVMKSASQKLSKRHGDASYEDLVAAGYLKEAVLNYIALLGWAPGGEEEIFTLDELVKVFSVSGISKSPAIFDMAKLNYINSEYLRRMTPEAFYEVALPWMNRFIQRQDIDKKLLASLLQVRCEYLSDMEGRVDFIDTMPDYSETLYVNKKMKTDPATALEALQRVLPVLEQVECFDAETIHQALFGLIEAMGVKNGYILWPVRVAVSGKESTPGGGIELCAILGKEESLARIRNAIAKLSTKA